MPFELLWLLLPVAAASGWLAARRIPRTAPGVGHDFSPEYFKGINYLLNEQPDKAIEVFIRMLEVDSDTVEPHFALGNLFRRQGEVDRAIRIHQNLIARPTLPRPLRNQALFELAQDYLQSGLFDRAEALFRELSECDPGNITTLRHLRDIYEQEHEWEKAIKVAVALEARTGNPLKGVIANYYCELAGQALRDGDMPRAKKMLRRAYAHDRGCVRASILAGDIAREAGSWRAAIKAYKRVDRQDPRYLSEIIEPLLDCCERSGQPREIVYYLRDALRRQPAFRPVLIFADHLRRHEGEAAARQFVADYLRDHPSLPGLRHLLEILPGEDGEVRRQDLHLARGIVERLLEDIPAYVCSSCGFKGRRMHWQCPSCRDWNCVQPC